MRASNSPEDLPKHTHHLRTLRTLMRYLWPVGQPTMQARVVAAIIFLAMAKGFLILGPYVYAKVIDALDATMAVVPVALIIAYGLTRLFARAFEELRDAVFSRVGQRAIRDIALSVFRHLHNLSLRFHLERRTGGLSRRIERGTQAIDFLLRFMLFNILPTLLEIVVVVSIMAGMFDWRFAVVTLVAVLSFIIFTFGVTEWRLKYRREMNKQDTEANTKAIDSLLNYETVKYYGNEAHEAARYDQALQRYEHAAVLSQTTLAALNIGQWLIIALCLSGMMFMGAQDRVAGQITTGDFVLIFMLLMQLFQPLNFLGMVYREIRRGLIDMETMFDLLDEVPEIKDQPHARELQVAGAELRFEHVDFGYGGQRQILHDVSFTVPPGHTVAIVGHSGAGKSTIARLLFRFYDVTGGRITIDGQDIRDVSQDSLRAAIGVVPQDTVLFNDSIGYNIAYGRPGADQNDVREAAKLAQIDGFISRLPEGYGTSVGERGLKLSGGEKQRVAIARTIIKDPPILVLDEATSALDSATEKDIQAALRRISRNRTCVVIAHRLSTVVEANEIIVLDEGRIVERGSHDSLVRIQDGVYRAMWERQQEAGEAEERLKELSEDV